MSTWDYGSVQELRDALVFEVRMARKEIGETPRVLRRRLTSMEIYQSAVEYLDEHSQDAEHADDEVLVRAVSGALELLEFVDTPDEKLGNGIIDLLRADIPPALLSVGTRIVDEAYTAFIMELRKTHLIDRVTFPSKTPQVLQRVLRQMMQDSSDAEFMEEIPEELWHAIDSDTIAASFSFEYDDLRRNAVILYRSSPETA